MRKYDIYIHRKQGMWKDNFALEITVRRFHYAVVASEFNRRIELERQGIKRRPHSTVNKTADHNPKRNRPKISITAVSFVGFETADKTVELRPRINNQSGPIDGFDSAIWPSI